MSQELKTVLLSGRLASKFGRTRKLAVSSPAEAAFALCMTVPGFEKELLAASERGVKYACFAGRRNISEEGLAQPVEEGVIRIVPVLQGSKRGGLFQVVLGAALIGAAFAAPQMGLGLLKLGTQGAVVAPALLGMGVSMALGGVVQMISPQQRGLSTRDNPENGASYSFNGPVNTTAQGNCVPVLYGEMMVGSAVVSAGIYAEDQA